MKALLSHQHGGRELVTDSADQATLSDGDLTCDVRNAWGEQCGPVGSGVLGHQLRAGPALKVVSQVRRTQLDTVHNQSQSKIKNQK